MEPTTVHFEAPGTPISINAAARMHWAALRRALQPWRLLLRRALAGHPATQGLPPCTVHVSLPFDTNRRRDPHNYTSPMVKALVDELVRAGVWPDDTPEWVSVAEPTLATGTSAVVIELRPR